MVRKLEETKQYDFASFKKSRSNKKSYNDYRGWRKESASNEIVDSYMNHVAIIRNMVQSHQISVTGDGGDFMNNEALTEKMHSIDTRLSLVENEVKHISSGISRLENDIKAIDQKIDTAIGKIDAKFDKMDARFEQVLEKFDKMATKEDVKSTRDELKNDLKDLRDGKRFTVTTWVALGSGLASAVAAVAAIIALTQ